MTWQDKPCDFGRGKDPTRYRMTHVGGKVVAVARVVYERSYGPIPAGLFVCHHCDTPACAEPTHLYLGTNRQNMQDASARGLLRRSPATRAKMRDANLGKHPTDATRQLISEHRTGARHTPDARARIGAGLRRAYAEGRR